MLLETLHRLADQGIGSLKGDMDICRILQNIQGEMRLFPNRVFLRDFCRSQTWAFHRTLKAATYV